MQRKFVDDLYQLSDRFYNELHVKSVHLVHNILVYNKREERGEIYAQLVFI